MTKWLIWNEPNQLRWLRLASPRLYTLRLLNPGYAAIHAAIAGAQVAGGGTAPRGGTGGTSPVAFLLGVEPQGVGGAHAHTVRSDENSRLRGRLPPDGVLADLIELLEGAPHPRFGRERGVNILGVDAVSQQGDLQGIFCAVAQPALTRVFTDIPEVGPGMRRIAELVGIDQRLRPREDPHPALGERSGNEILRGRNARRIEFFEEAQSATPFERPRFDLHHVPDGRAGLHHLRQFGDLAVVGQ